MTQSSLWLRAFVGLLIGILPPLIVLAAILQLGGTALAGANPGLIAVAVIGGVVAWSAILAVLFGRALNDEFHDLLELARGGGPGASAEASSAHQRMASLLDERNRQVGHAGASGEPRPDRRGPGPRGAIAGRRQWHRSSATRRGGVRSWRPTTRSCCHRASTTHWTTSWPTEAISDLERWASTAEAETPARHVDGPWGAFNVVDVAMTGGTRAILYAPWQGRPAPTRAELDLLTLVGQHAGTALEHSLLYARVRSQADELNRMAAVQADFLRGVTHDLQTPLTSIGALATELKADAAVPDTARADLDTISHQADRLRRMVSQLLVASRLEAGVFTPQSEVFAVPPVVERTWAALRADRPFELTADRDASPGGGRSGSARAGPVGGARQRGQVQPGGLARRRPPSRPVPARSPS